MTAYYTSAIFIRTLTMSLQYGNQAELEWKFSAAAIIVEIPSFAARREMALQMQHTSDGGL